jgi:hypothetical protein
MRASDPASSPDAARWTFARPYRTRGMRLFNWVGRAARGWGWRRELSRDAILARARRNTGLSDWGDESFLEPMGILVESLEREARLTPFGRLVLRNSLTHMTENRLRVERLVAENPEILDEPVRRPLFVIGLPRTGTTLLYNLLARDPRARPLMAWETFFPAPLGNGRAERVDVRPRNTRRIIRFLNAVAPQLKDVHPLDADGIEECTWLMANTFTSPSFSLMGDVPAYVDWLWEQDHDRLVRAYKEYRRQLQVLQWQLAGQYWVLKSPVHLQSLDALLEVFPDACIVQTHRDPDKVIPSACSLLAVLHGVYSDDVDRGRLGEEMTSRLARTLERAAEARTRHADRVLDVQFRELVRDKLGTVHKIHEHFGYEHDDRTEERMRSWLEQHPHHAGHRYELEQFGLSKDMLEGAFRAYREEFGIARES